MSNGDVVTPFQDPVWVDGVTPLNSANMTKLQTRDEKNAAGGYIGLDSGGNATIPGYIQAARFVAVTAAPTSFSFRSYATPSDTTSMFDINGNGKMWWGPGGTAAADTSLYRYSVGQLQTDQNFAVVGTVSVGSEVIDSAGKWFINPDGVYQWGPGDWSRDLDLWRLAAGVLKTTGEFRAAKTISSYAGTGGLNTSYMADGMGAGGYYFIGRMPGDTQWRYMVDAVGTVLWGPGGSTPSDTSLSRIAPKTLTTDSLIVNGSSGYNPGLRIAGAAGYEHALQLFKNLTDTQPTLLIAPDGAISWGPGTGVDTSLYRGAVNTLNTSGAFYALSIASNTTVYSTSTLYAQVSAIIDQGNTGGKLFFGSATDTNLYRSAAANLRTDGSFIVGSGISLDKSGAGSGLYFGAANDVLLSRAGAGQLALQGGLLWVANRPNATDVAFQTGPPSGLGFFFTAVGSMNWASPGGAADTNLYRNGAGTLKTDGVFQVGGTLYGSFGVMSGSSAFYLRNDSARINFGVADDTNLYRSAANTLKTDSAFIASTITSPTITATSNLLTNGNVFVDQGGTGAKIHFGSAVDTHLYRSGVGTLATDGKFSCQFPSLFVTSILDVGAPDSGGVGYRAVRVPN